jgi:hypothetical protein
MRLDRLLLVLLSATLLLACSRNATISQAFAACRDRGKSSSVVSFQAWFIDSNGWRPHASETPFPPSPYARLNVSADFGRRTPLKGVPVRVEDDHRVFAGRVLTYMQHLTLQGTFICKDPQTRVDMLSGYFVPTSAVFDKKSINGE